MASLYALLLYFSSTTRPDIAAAAEILSRKANSPDHYDWNAVTRMSKYLNSTADLKLKISHCKEPQLVGHMDANWHEAEFDIKSTSGFLFFYGGNLIHWTSKRQDLIAGSTAEVEGIAASNACDALEWIIGLLKDFGVEESKPITVYEDNIPASQ